jgi:hypothetical protein
MHFLRPDATWLLLLLAIPVLLYLLPLPRRRATLASTLIWRKAIQGGMVARRRRLWRVIGAIALAVTTVALIVAALAKVAFVPREEAAEIVAIVVDNSASMQADDGGSSRFDRARRQALDLAETLTDDAKLILVTTAPATEVVVRQTSDPSVILDALKRMKPSDAPGSLRATLRHISHALNEKTAIHVFTDGAETLAREAFKEMNVRWHIVRGDSANAGIVAFGARRVESPKPSLLVEATVSNFADAPRKTQLQLRVDGADVEPRSVTAPARSEVAVAWTLSLETLSVARGLPAKDSARLELEMTPGDAFPLDDGAAAAIEPEKRRRVVVVAEKSPPHLLAALRADSTVRAFVTTPANYRASTEADLTIFTGSLPMELGPGNVVLVDPAATNALVEPTGEEVEVNAVTFDPAEPIVRGLAWRPGLVKSAAGIKTPSRARAVLSCDAGPLILTGELDGRKAVVLAFDPETQPIARTRTFPILVRNIVDALTPPASDVASRPVAGLLSAEESDLRTRIDTGGTVARAGVSPTAIWTGMILLAIALLVVEAFLYHRQTVE